MTWSLPFLAGGAWLRAVDVLALGSSFSWSSSELLSSWKSEKYSQNTVNSHNKVISHLDNTCTQKAPCSSPMTVTNRGLFCEFTLLTCWKWKESNDLVCLKYWCLNKLQMTFLNTSWTKMITFWLKFHWSLLVKVQWIGKKLLAFLSCRLTEIDSRTHFKKSLQAHTGN